MDRAMSNKLLVAALWGVTLAGVAGTGLTVAWISFAPVTVALLILVVLVGYCRFRGLLALAESAENLALVTTSFFAGLILSYVAASGTAPMADPWLQALDRRLGFDWWSYVRFFDAHPRLARIGHLIYLSMFPQLGLATFTLSLRRPAAARQFVAAIAIALALTCLISVLTPAVGIYAALHVDLAQLPNLHPAVIVQTVEPLAQLRAGTFPALVCPDSVGLISFPSFHCAAGTLLIWAAWRFRVARWPGTALNLVLIASTPVEGAHYLVDGIAGVLVAITALALAARLHAIAGWTMSAARRWPGTRAPAMGRAG